MVGVATGAGLSVKGGLDTSMIERGFDRVRQSFESVKAQSKSFTADLIRMENSSANLVKQLNRVGIIGVSAIIGLASQAPAVAGSMAKISVQTDRLIRTLGKQFAPEFSKISDMYTKFVNFVEGHPDLTKGLVFGATAVAGFAAAGKFVKILGLSTVSSTLLTALGGIAKIMAVPIAAGVAAAGIGSEVGTSIGERTYKEGGFSEDVARFIVERPTLRAGIEGYAGLGEAVVNFFKSLISGGEESNPDLE